MSKTILQIVGDDVQCATGSIQLCAGQTAGIEAAIHATTVRSSYADTEGILLVRRC